MRYRACRAMDVDTTSEGDILREADRAAFVAGREERRKGGDRSRLEGKLEVVTQGGTLEVVIGGGFSLCEDREWEIDCEL
jgi:hypothetical protein